MSRQLRGEDGTRRALCVGAIAGAALALLGCGSVGPRTVELSQARLQELVARHFPVDKRLLDVIDLTLDSPRVGLQPEANRISVEVALQGERRRSDPDPTLRLACSSARACASRPSDNTVRLVDVQVERFVIDGLPASWQRQLDRLGKPLARGLLEDQVLYTLRPKDVAALEGRGTSARRPARHRQRRRDHARRGRALRRPFIPGTEAAANMPPFAMRRRVWT